MPQGFENQPANGGQKFSPPDTQETPSMSGRVAQRKPVGRVETDPLILDD